LPGWGSGEFLFGDDTTIIEVVVDRNRQQTHPRLRPRPWQLVMVQGRWRRDAWGSGRLEAEEVTALSGDATRNR
jgi:hypothetical protein